MNAQGKGRMAYKLLYSSLLAAGMAVLPGTATAFVPFGGFADFCGPPPGDYDNNTPQLFGKFTDLRQGPNINDDYAACQLNLTGSVGSSGDMWITLVNGVEGGIQSCAQLNADVTIHRFDNRKAVGFVADYSTGLKTGLFLGLYDNGNNDALTLSTFQAGAAPVGPVGTLTSTVATKFLGSKIHENVWYHLRLDFCDDGGNLFGTGIVSGGDLAGPETLPFDVPFPAGIATVGFVGIAGYARYSFVDSSVKNFSWVPEI